jgi:hypothetical protein
VVWRDLLIDQHDVAADGLSCVAPRGATNDDTDARQPDCVRAHDAWLDAGVQRAAGQIAGASPLKSGSQCFYLRVSRRIMASTHRFDSFGHDLVTVHYQ